MSQQVVCNTCGEVIDETVAYYTAHAQIVQLTEGALVAQEGSVRLDYHADHLPGQMTEHIEHWRAGGD